MTDLIADGQKVQRITESTNAQMQHPRQENQKFRRKNKEEEDKNNENILPTIIKHYQQLISSKTLISTKLLEDYNRSMTKYKKGVIE